MPLVINHNMMAMTASRNLAASFGKLGVSVNRLSSGLRITSAADDAAGLAVRELMRSDISTLNQGVRNANDAISLIQTADGALGVIDEKLIRMKELAEQAATGTYTSTQRAIIDSEYQAMASEITRIANATEFNGIKLLNGTLSGTHFGGNALSTTNRSSSGELKVHFGTANVSSEDYYYIQIGTVTASALGFGGSAGASATTRNLSSAEIVAANNFSNVQAAHANWSAGNLFYDNTPAGVRSQFADQAWTEYRQVGVKWAVLTDSSGTQHALCYALNDAFIPNPGFSFTVTETTAGSAGAGGSSITTQSNAQAALLTINNAIVSKDKIRADLGALQNRFQNTITNLQVQSENLQAAESRISDVDVSEEMTEFTRQQILSQAAVAMLAQANSLPRMAMQLLGG